MIIPHPSDSDSNPFTACHSHFMLQKDLSCRTQLRTRNPSRHGLMDHYLALGNRVALHIDLDSLSTLLTSIFGSSPRRSLTAWRLGSCGSCSEAWHCGQFHPHEESHGLDFARAHYATMHTPVVYYCVLNFSRY